MQSSEIDIVTICLTGDVMTGRGVDQILPHPSHPVLYESYVRDARDYVRLAESENGSIPAPVDFGYVWGDALATFKRADVRIVNLETSITRSDSPWPGKGIHYRMHPGNAAVLTAAGIDCCGLANNHVLDWGREGLKETLDTLEGVDVHQAGAGHKNAVFWYSLWFVDGTALRTIRGSLGEASRPKNTRYRNYTPTNMRKAAG